MEPDHLWEMDKTAVSAEEISRNNSEEPGLWRGHCYTPNRTEHLVLAVRPAMITTPLEVSSPGDPFGRAFSMSMAGSDLGRLTEEPDSTLTGTVDSRSMQTMSLSAMVSPPPEARSRAQEPRGLHMLHGLDERLRKEKISVELEERITIEFDDAFVTQVYNYLSLGYPATGRAYDDELSKISHLSKAELERDDESIMQGVWGANDEDEHGDPKIKAAGHIMIDNEEKPGVKEEDRCPRWKALKDYIYEWARQHPDLDAISPLAWGMQERRGSWGL
jgi:hypothetical protein